MGSRGPQPLPTDVKKARGTYRPDRAVRNEARPTGKLTCPGWLSKDAKKEFRRMVKLLSEMGVTGSIDLNLLARYCTTWVRWRQAIKMLESSGEVFIYRDSKEKIKAIQPSAFHAIARSLADELSRMEASLGANPSARSRIEVVPPQTPTNEQSKSRFFDAPMRLAE